jgi:hypothetical protein
MLVKTVEATLSHIQKANPVKDQGAAHRYILLPSRKGMLPQEPAPEADLPEKGYSKMNVLYNRSVCSKVIL